MPRTKQSYKLKSHNEESEQIKLSVKDFERQTRLKIRKCEIEYDILTKEFTNKIDLAFSTLPKKVRETLTLGDLLKCRLDQLRCNTSEKNVNNTNNDHVQECNESSRILKNEKKFKRCSVTPIDDGYATETGIQSKSRQHQSRIDAPRRITKQTSILQRSNSLSETKNARSISNQRSKSTSKQNQFTTPVLSQQQNKYNLVTPKVKPNTPITVLRRPQEGEIALSLQGSPLLVSTITSNRTANINIPLDNGDVISFLPNNGLRFSNIPKLDDETMKQLRTLKGHIEKVIRHR